MNGFRRTLRLLLPVGAVIGIWWLSSWVDHTLLKSPVTDHTAVTQTRRFKGLIPTMPGQGGDTPGRLEVFSPTGRSCGTLDLPMVNLAYDGTWSVTQFRVRLLGAVALCD